VGEQSPPEAEVFLFEYNHIFCLNYITILLTFQAVVLQTERLILSAKSGAAIAVDAALSRMFISFFKEVMFHRASVCLSVLATSRKSY